MTSMIVQRHNEKVFNAMQPGDLLQFKRQLYSHWAVVVDDENIVHLSGEDDDIDLAASSIRGLSNKAIVRKDKFWDVVQDSRVEINNSSDKKHKPDNVSEIVYRALTKIGEKGYNLIWKNCEHFANWCRYGKTFSQQVDTGLTVAAGAAVSIGAVALGYFFASKDSKKT